MEGSKYDCIIIGGGISGISFAHYLHTIGKKVLVLEQQKRVGGQIHSLCSQQKSAYWRELGSHTCYNTYTYLLSIVKDIQKEDMVKHLGKGRYVLFSDGRIKKMSAEISFPSMIFNCFKMFFLSKKGKTVGEYFSKIVGRGNYRRLFSRLFRAVICQPANDYPAELFLKHRTDRYKEFPRKYTFAGGISSFINAIVEHDKIEVLTGKKVAAVKKEGTAYYELTTETGDCFFADSVAFASDPHTTSALLKDIDSPLSDLLATIPLFTSEALNVVVPKAKLSVDAVAGIIPTSDDFMSAVSRDLIDDPDLRSFTIHFEGGKKNDEEKAAIICRVLGIEEGDIVETAHMSHTLPAVKVSHLDMAAQVDNIKKDNNLFILGNYFYGLSLEDCIHRSYDEFEWYKRFVHSDLAPLTVGCKS